MDIKKALELVESGRFEELDIDDLWELINILSVSSDPQAFQALVKVQNSKLGQSLPQMNQQMHYIMEQNAQALASLEKGFNLFALDAKGNPKQNAVWPIFNFFRHVDIENREGAEPVEAKDVFSQAVGIAKLTAKKDILLDKNFSKQKPEEQQKTYANAVLMAMEETAFVLVSNQILEDTLAKKHTPLSKVDRNEIAAKAEKSFAEVIRPKTKTRFLLSNGNIISTFAAEVNRAGNKALLAEQNTTSPSMVKEVEAVEKMLQSQYSETMQLLRPLAQYQQMAFVAGQPGRNMFGADYIAKTVHENNPAKGQTEVSLFAFLKDQPSKIKSFSQSIVRSIKKAYTLMAEAVSLKLSSEKFAEGLKSMFAFFRGNKDNKNAKYKGIGIKTADGNLRIISAKASQILLSQSTADKRVIAWKDFRNTFHNSQLGRAMFFDAERAELRPENVEDYVKVTPIVLKNKKKSAKSWVKKAINMVGQKILSPNKLDRTR